MRWSALWRPTGMSIHLSFGWRSTRVNLASKSPRRLPRGNGQLSESRFPRLGFGTFATC
jgi:hypothetical protein